MTLEIIADTCGNQAARTSSFIVSGDIQSNESESMADVPTFAVWPLFRERKYVMLQKTRDLRFET